jgi:septum formation protein
MWRAPKFVLASNSPRRREILSSVGASFDVVCPDVDETRETGEPPRDMALRLAELKAVSASRGTGGLLTVGADTVVDADGEPMGKPRGRDDALRMLRVLANRSHLVHTGVALASSGRLLSSEVETTKVTFGALCEDDLLDFVKSGDGDDKAGAYAIQGTGALLIERIDGCYYNVVGLPVFRLRAMMQKLAAEASNSVPGNL